MRPRTCASPPPSLPSDSCCGAGRYTEDYGYDDVIAAAQAARGEDPFGYRAEFLSLVRLGEERRRHGALAVVMARAQSAWYSPMASSSQVAR